MNKVITDGLVLMPPPFEDGLDVWASGDGTPGSDTYAGSGGGAIAPADQDFGSSIEILKSQTVQKLRYMGETTVLPGCYLQITARVKCLSGPLPDVRIAGWPGQAGGSELTGVTTTGPSTALTGYGDVVEISAIVGTGVRNGVDMVWTDASYGHFGIDITGSIGAVVRVDDIEIRDVTGVFLRDMMGVVDVRDYGAVGDGVTDDWLAFELADNDAQGREILVSAGTYYLGNDVTLSNQVRFEGTLTMPDDKRVIFQKNFDYPTYVDAFADEELAFRKGFQAFLNFADHEGFDLGGRRISLNGPIDMQAALSNKTRFETRRVMRNGQFQVNEGAAWDDDVVVAAATYDVTDPLKLTGVVNIASIAVGSYVEGNGVGREIYVREVDVSTSEITLNRPLFDAAGTQPFTFTRFKYMLDFSGFEKLSDFVLNDIEFDCDGHCSAVMLPPDGLLFQVRDCHITEPKDRGLTSIGEGCQGMIIDRNNFVSNEQPLRSNERTSVAFNINKNDAKIRNNRSVRFRHFGVLSGGGYIISGNHFFQGDNFDDGPRTAGLVLASQNPTTTINSNYIDNCFVEWGNEHDADPSVSGYSFGGLTISNNICLSIGGQASFSWLVVKPYGPGHTINGLNVQGNVFRTSNTRITRVERIDTTYATFDMNAMRNILFEGNAFNGIDEVTRNPHIDIHRQNSPDSTWTVDTGTYLPFGGFARTIDTLVPVQAIRNSGGSAVFHAPYADPVNGANTHEFNIVWPEAVEGNIRYSVRMDEPS